MCSSLLLGLFNDNVSNALTKLYTVEKRVICVSNYCLLVCNSFVLRSLDYVTSFCLKPQTVLLGFKFPICIICVCGVTAVYLL